MRSKVNRCNCSDSWVDEKRYTGKMEKTDVRRCIRETEIKSRGSSRSNRVTIERFTIYSTIVFNSKRLQNLLLPLFRLITFSSSHYPARMFGCCSSRPFSITVKPFINPAKNTDRRTSSSPSAKRESRPSLHIIVLAKRPLPASHSRISCATSRKAAVNIRELNARH